MRCMRTLPLLAALVLAPLVTAADTPPSCTHAAGALPADTLPAGSPHGAQVPVDHIVVLMQENRSYDHYFGRLHGQGQRRSEAVPRNASNPDPGGGKAIRPFRQRRYCELADLAHSWNASHQEWDGGAMDGFTAANIDANDPSGRRTMGFYTKGDLPFYYKLYRTFAIGDRYFCSVLSSTFPNRFFLLAGTSFGHIRNDLPPGGAEFSQRTIFNLLDEAGVSWKVYYSLIPFALEFGYARNDRAANLVPIAQYFTDAAAGTLPQVAFVDPIFLGGPNTENDEHPPSNVQVGEEFAARVIGAAMGSPLWPHSALFLNYDEHGGFYDHVPPPPACVPDAIAPMREAGDVAGEFDRYGIRVPVVVVSPYARKHFVSHTVHDHTSVLRFIETRFDLPALTARDANADPMLEMFDFANPPFVKPPHLPPAPIRKKQRNQCAGGPSNGNF
jgi:phospholipase C